MCDQGLCTVLRVMASDCGCASISVIATGGPVFEGAFRSYCNDLELLWQHGTRNDTVFTAGSEPMPQDQIAA